MHCLKKAKRFAAWLEAAVHQEMPYVLLTDWREVKPCLQVMARTESPRPFMIVVFLDEPLHLDRVLNWTRSLPIQGISDRMHVILDVCELKVLLADMVHRLRHAEALQSWTWAASSGIGFDSEPVRVQPIMQLG